MSDNLEFNTKYKEVLIDTFEEFIRFMESKKLHYFAAGGTALGAARHKNLIPWDDDIDLFIPRADYEKLKEYRNDLPKGFSIVFPEDKNSTAIYAKFINDNTTFWEYKQLPYLYGVFIDLFPLDSTTLSQIDFVKKFRRFHRLRQYYFLSSCKFSLKGILSRKKFLHKKMYYVNILSLLFPGFLRPYYRKKILNLENYVKNCTDGIMLCDYLGSYYEKEYLPKDWFDNSIKMPFDRLSISMPKGYDEYLKYVYGDYMKLPPIEKRVAEHNHFYVNLSKKLTKEEALARIKQGYSNEI